VNKKRISGKASGCTHLGIRSYFTRQDYTDVMQSPSLVSRVLPGNLIYSTPVISLIAANLITIILAILGNWDLATVMFIYWAQSIIIGFFTVMSLLLVNISPTAPGKEQPEQQPGGPRTIYIQNPWVVRCILVGFFTLPYVIFHWVYYSFIVDSGFFGTVHFSDPAIWVSCGVFFANHLYSYIAYNHRVSLETMDFYEYFLLPYRRIIPMHLTIIFGGILLLILQFIGIQSTIPVLVLFLVLKTLTDVAAHIDKHQPKTSSDGAATSI